MDTKIQTFLLLINFCLKPFVPIPNKKLDENSTIFKFFYCRKINFSPDKNWTPIVILRHSVKTEAVNILPHTGTSFYGGGTRAGSGLRLVGRGQPLDPLMN